MSRITIAKIIIVIITTAIIFYNLGISVTLKNLEPHSVSGGYEITLFGNTYFYTD